MKKYLIKMASYIMIFSILVGNFFYDTKMVFGDTIENVSCNTENYCVTIKITDTWEQSYKALIQIQNKSKYEWENWRVNLQTDSIIEQVWNAKLLCINEDYISLESESYNKTLAPGETIEIGFIGTSENKSFETEVLSVAFEAGIKDTKTSYTYDDYVINFNKITEWDDSYCMNVEITNNGDSVMDKWSLIYHSKDTINSIWNASIVYQGEEMIYVSNVEWNRQIKPGETVSFGYIAQNNYNYECLVDPTLIIEPQEEQTDVDFELIEQESTNYGIIYHVQNSNELQTYALWDVVDVVMAGASWAELIANPSWKNFGWAVLDTAAILPVIPSTAYVRKSGKIFIKVDELAKFAKTEKGRKALNAAIKGYRYSDGIKPKAIKEIEKTFKGKEGTVVVNLFKAAANRGLVGKTNQAGIKKLTGKIDGKYTHEIKLIGKYGAYRIFGYQNKNGEWIFDNFKKAHK